VTAIGLAKAAGARVIATSRGADKAAQALELGADLSIDTLTQDFEAVARAEGGVDVILDMVGGPYLPRNLEVLACEGRLVQIAFLQGSTATVDLRPLMTKRLTLTGSTLRPRTPADKARIAAALRSHVWPLLEAGNVRPVMDRTFPLAEAAAAHTRMEQGDHIGKIVLTVGD
jgi:NADPH2:quinone reductase